MPTSMSAAAAARQPLDIAVIGAGLSGLYALYELRRNGFNAVAFDRASDVGGSWWWNCYPGARVDSPSAPFYSYTEDIEALAGWQWDETQPTRDTILEYLRTFARNAGLYQHVVLDCTIDAAHYDPADRRWELATATGEEIRAQYLISAAGTLSESFTPNIPGISTFEGEQYHTGHWPQEVPVEFRGKKIGVIGTGASGVQIIPQIAKKAERLYVFQRTPQYVVPARNRNLDSDYYARIRTDWTVHRGLLRDTGRPFPLSTRKVFDDDWVTREAKYEAAWAAGGMSLRETYADHMSDVDANNAVSAYVRRKILETVHNPRTARSLVPDYYFATKRQILGSDYYETYNRDNVELIDLRETPIDHVDHRFVVTVENQYDLDMLVLATGYDALTGALTSLDPTGLDGRTIAKHWDAGPRTYLGILVSGFPNLMMIQGPQSPSVKYHMAMGTERQVGWITSLLLSMRSRGATTVEAEPEAEDEWSAEVAEVADGTLYMKTSSWYWGSNIPGKPRTFMVYLDGPRFHRRLDEVQAGGYAKLRFE